MPDESDLSQSLSCCATHILAQQPDFACQPSRLELVVRGRGHLFEMYPKFHCDCILHTLTLRPGSQRY
ncbi:hypothetical protein V1522DRAFT_414741 [Lipomyces starkeyi]